eukprot:NODE_89_length_21810_cov_0.170098.p5 type:complete len:356 gc:universal NODE_89_length_21810_cov_0.170098:9499-10566(+)
MNFLDLLYSIPILVVYASIQISTILSPMNCLDDRPSSSLFLFIADPQIEGMYKLNQGWIDALDLYVNDISMSLVYRLAYFQYQPEYVVILGDLFSFQHTQNPEFEWRLKRYKRMFPIYNEHFYNLSGNHDIGYGWDMREWMVKRYESAFGQTNFIVKTAEFEMIFLNSMALDGTFEDSIFNNTWNFVKSLPEKEKPRLLFMHIPLYPSNVTYCESNSYRESNGLFHFQNYLTKDSSLSLLNLLSPDFVISGHNHDGCLSEIHRSPDYKVEEFKSRELNGTLRNTTFALTVRSVMGLYDGGFAFLSVRGSKFHYKECISVNFLTVRIFLVINFIILISFLILICAFRLSKSFKGVK